MGDWLDRWARASASPPDRTRPARPAGTGLTRRQLMKRAGVVAGAMWTAPLIQTALAPPAAASGAITNLPNTSACTGSDQCASGNCSMGYCAPVGLGWAGATCAKNSDCVSNKCEVTHGSPNGTPKTCQANVAKGGTCASTADCKPEKAGPVACTSSNVCGGIGADCAGTDHKGHDNLCIKSLYCGVNPVTSSATCTDGSPGSACNKNDQCAGGHYCSGVDHVCTNGAKGDTCDNKDQCQQECKVGVCTGKKGDPCSTDNECPGRCDKGTCK